VIAIPIQALGGAFAQDLDEAGEDGTKESKR